MWVRREQLNKYGEVTSTDEWQAFEGTIVDLFERSSECNSITFHRTDGFDIRWTRIEP